MRTGIKLPAVVVVVTFGLLPIVHAAEEQTGGCRQMAAAGCWDMSITNCAEAVGNDTCHESYYLRYTCSKPIRLGMILDDGQKVIHDMGEGHRDEIYQPLTNVWDFGKSPVVRGMECCDGEAFSNCESDPDIWN